MLISRDSSPIGWALSMVLALSLALGSLSLGSWMASGGTKNLPISTRLEVRNSDRPHEEPVRIASVVDREEGSKGSDAPVDHVGEVLERDVLAPVADTARRGWTVDVRSSMSQRARAGQGARGPPVA